MPVCPGTAILSAELAHRYKPDLEVLPDGQGRTVWASARPVVLDGRLATTAIYGAAQQGGLPRTAFVVRPLEYGPGQARDLVPEFAVDIAARDFYDLAEQLGA